MTVIKGQFIQANPKGFAMPDKPSGQLVERGKKMLREHCYEEGVLMSFDQLKQKYHLPNRDFFSYLQLRNFIRVTQGTMEPT